MSEYALKYQAFVDYGEEILEPIHGLGVYAAQRRHPKGNGFGRTEVRQKFAVIDVDAEEILHQSAFVTTNEKHRLGRYRYYAIGYRQALLDERDMEDDQ